jgi:hypothetical protein
VRVDARDWAVKLKDLTDKIAFSHYNRNGFPKDTQHFLCRECEHFDGFRSTDPCVTVRHIMEEHPYQVSVKSAKKV